MYEQMDIPVTNLSLYVTMSKHLGVDLSDVYLFRQIQELLPYHFQGYAVANRLQLHFQALHLHDGETMHGF